MQLEQILPGIESLIRSETGTRFVLREHRPVGGGDSHPALAVSDGSRAFFVKLAQGQHAAQLAAEADGLDALRRSGALRVPDLVGLTAVTQTTVALVLEKLDMRPLADADDGRRFAHALAALHEQTGSDFGWHRDNFIGNTPQLNTSSRNWARFFVEQRIRPQLERTRELGDPQLMREGRQLIKRIPALFLDYRPQPSLLHGDLWHGNAAVMADSGQPVVFDPAVYYGDAETDLAMTELFGGFPAAFYAEYRRVRGVSDEYEQRKPLYNLYHVLNHLNLFGRAYLGEARRLIQRLNRELGSDLG